MQKIIEHYRCKTKYNNYTHPFIIMDHEKAMHMFYQDHHTIRCLPHSSEITNEVGMLVGLEQRGKPWFIHKIGSRYSWHEYDFPGTSFLGFFIYSGVSRKMIDVFDIMDLPGLINEGGEFITRWVPNDSNT